LVRDTIEKRTKRRHTVSAKIGTVGELIGYTVAVQISDQYHINSYFSGIGGWASTGLLTIECAREIRNQQRAKGRNAWIQSVHTGNYEPEFRDYDEE
jgi:hypothetical protein